jgi:ZIP family zinc transporter
LSQAETLILGTIAGVTIVLGLPVGRLKSISAGVRLFLMCVAIGILTFLVWDVLDHAYQPLDGALGRLHAHTAGVGPVLGYAALFLGGLTVGLVSLVYYERWLDRRGRPKPFAPGAMTPGELTAAKVGIAGWAPAKRLSLLVAAGIGLHNFGEGLAIGASAAAGAIGLATVLVIGFALHNATEGFGIVGPLAGESELPSWRFLWLMALIGGGPTILGTVLGRQFSSPAMSVVFFTLAAGSILYVVIQLLGVAQRSNRKDVLYWGILLGLALGFVTDMVVTAGGA